MKKIIRYVIVIILLLILAGVSIYTFFNIHYSNKGNIKIDNKYYDIKFTNPIVYENDLIVKINDEEDTLHIDIPNVIKDKEYSFSIDAKNIGNENINIKDVLYKNINTNIEENDISISSNVSETEVIAGGEEKKLDIIVKYTGNDMENLYYSFDIKYLFIK